MISCSYRWTLSLALFLLLSLGISSIPIVELLAQNPINQTRRAFKKAIRPIINEKRRTERDINRLNRMFSKNKRTYDANSDTASVIVWNKQPYIPNKGMIRDYQYIYRFLHQQEAVYFDAAEVGQAEILWDSTTNAFFLNKEQPPIKRDDFGLFGWIPHWMDEAATYLPYRMLSQLSYFGYEVDPESGRQLNPAILRNSGLKTIMDSAAVHGVQTYLTVSLIGEEPLRRFLSSTDRQDRLSADVLSVVDTLGFDGVELDFEQLPNDLKEAYTRFVRTMGTKLKQQSERIGRPQYLMVDVPFYDQDSSYDLKAMRPFIDWVNILAYNFSGEGAAYPGSISPLRSNINQPNLETAVNDVLNQQIAPSSIILSMPLFGDLWKVTGAQQGIPPEFVKSFMYGDIQSTLDLDYYPTYDAYTGSAFYMIEDKETNEQYMFWFESDESYRVKTSWMQEKQLGGMGLWALGYEKGDAEFWDAMQQAFMIAPDSLSRIEPLMVERGMIFGVMQHIIDHQSIFGVAFLFFATAIILGLVFSLTDWKVREKLFASAFFRYFNGILILVFALSGILILSDLQQPVWLILSAVFAGAIAFFVSVLSFTLYRKYLQ